MNKPLVLNCKNNFRVVAVAKLPLDVNNDVTTPELDISMDELSVVLGNKNYTVTKIGNIHE